MKPTARQVPAASKTATGPGRRSARWGVFRFVVVFLVLAALAEAAETLLLRHDALMASRRLVATAASCVTAVVGVRPQVSGDVLVASGRMLKITVECTAVFATGAFWAAAIALWCPWRRMLVGILVGLVGVAATNILRIAMLVLFAAWSSNLFTFAHDVLMQGYLLLMVAPLWVVWAVWAVRPPKRPSPRPGPG